MISISSQTASAYLVVLDEDAESEINRFTRRVSRVSTLDGGSVVTDSGYTDTDRNLRIQADVTKSQQGLLEYMLKNYSLWNVSTKNGCFVCAPKTMTVDDGELILVLYIAE
jgi:hypothetical protein